MCVYVCVCGICSCTRVRTQARIRCLPPWLYTICGRHTSPTAPMQRPLLLPFGVEPLWLFLSHHILSAANHRSSCLHCLSCHRSAGITDVWVVRTELTPSDLHGPRFYPPTQLACVHIYLPFYFFFAAVCFQMGVSHQLTGQISK